jgi:hypothetical protein
MPAPTPQAAYGLFQQNFDNLITANSVNVVWRKSHACPCTATGGGMSGIPGVTGTAKPNCRTCHGTGVYWDAPSDPFPVLLTLMNMNRSPDEPGARLDATWGQELTGSPSITLAESVNPIAWAEASVDDQFIEVDATARYNAVLIAGVREVVPFFENLSIASGGAVTVWNSQTYEVSGITSYTVYENQVLTNLPQGTPYVVEFTASPVYLINRKPGGQPHVRPFGMAQGQSLPRRFQARQIDIWLRARFEHADDTKPGAPMSAPQLPRATVGKL